MEFFAIMLIGTAIAVWAVAGSRPTRKIHRQSPPPLKHPGEYQNTREPEIWQYQPKDQIEYLEALDLHLNDPVRNPAPSLPPRKNLSF